MLQFLVPIIVIPLSYAIGCFSAARLVAKGGRSLNVYKVGTGLADTENIYFNVSRLLGVLVGAIDVTKLYLWLEVLHTVLVDSNRYWGMHNFATENWLLFFALAALVGHCLPYTQHFRGGRGVLTFTGIMLYFAFWPTLISGLLALFFIFRFRQVRFAQYTSVILPAFLALLSNRFLHTGYTGFIKLFALILIMGALNFVLSKRLGEF
jgi:acyl phosphate:glycerol-3-phosphate acyltransferase